jgi:hypothetical protein
MGAYGGVEVQVASLHASNCSKRRALVRATQPGTARGEEQEISALLSDNQTPITWSFLLSLSLYSVRHFHCNTPTPPPHLASSGYATEHMGSQMSDAVQSA